MKRFILCLFVLCLVNSVSEVKADYTFRVAPPLEVVKSTGSFVVDTGKKVCEGITTTVFGIGEIVTAPLRADFYKPRKKVYRFYRPSLIIEYQKGKLESK